MKGNYNLQFLKNISYYRVSLRNFANNCNRKII